MAVHHSHDHQLVGVQYTRHINQPIAQGVWCSDEIARKLTCLAAVDRRRRLSQRRAGEFADGFLWGRNQTEITPADTPAEDPCTGYQALGCFVSVGAERAERKNRIRP